MTTRSSKPAGATSQPDPVTHGAGHAPATDSNGGAKLHPTDLELMMCFDGELDDARSRDLLALAAADTGSRTKLAALHIVSDVLRHQADAGPGGDIADLVMARIAREDNQPPSSTSAMGSAGSGEPGAHVPLHSLRFDPANDNARGIFALAAIAVAAAAGMMLWGRMDPQAPVPEAVQPVAAVATTNQAAAVPLAPPAQEEQAPADAEPEHGVEVAAVDFGTRTGTIFYIPSDAASSKHTTTVVWLADDLGGK